MKRVLIVGALAALSACTLFEPPAGSRAGNYRDISGQGRNEAQLSADEAACQYQLASMAYGQNYQPPIAGNYGEYTQGTANLQRAMMAAPPGEGLYQTCMTSRGWQLVSYR